MNDGGASLEIDSIKSIVHLRIVAGTFQKLGLAPIIDRANPKIRSTSTIKFSNVISPHSQGTRIYRKTPLSFSRILYGGKSTWNT